MRTLCATAERLRYIEGVEVRKLKCSNGGGEGEDDNKGVI